MTLQDYWQILRRSWALILATTLVGALAAFGMSKTQTPLYQAQAGLFISVQSTASEIAYSGGYYVQDRVKSYVEVVDSPGVLDPVIDELGLDTTASGLAGQISAFSPPETVLVSVTAVDTSAEQATLLANAAAASFAKEIQRLEITESGTKPVKASIIKPAEVPGAPISPRTTTNVILGALLGLMVGVGIAILRQLLDTSVKSVDGLEAAADATCLGVVTFDPDAATKPLVTLRGSPRSEAFRSLRTNLQYVDVDNPPKVVVVTSSIPGEGKSTTACNLAITLALAGSKVLFLEGDLRRPKAADYLGVDGSVGLTDVLIGEAELTDTIINWRRDLLDFLPAGAIPPNPSELLASQHMSDLLTRLRDTYDVVVIDAPPLLPVTDAAILTTIADGAILVVRHGVTRGEQVEEAADAVRQVSGRILGTVLNFAPTRRRRGYGYSQGYAYDDGYQSAGTPETDEGSATDGGRRLAAEGVPATDSAS